MFFYLRNQIHFDSARIIWADEFFEDTDVTKDIRTKHNHNNNNNNNKNNW